MAEVDFGFEGLDFLLDVLGEVVDVGGVGGAVVEGFVGGEFGDGEAAVGAVLLEGDAVVCIDAGDGGVGGGDGDIGLGIGEVFDEGCEVGGEFLFVGVGGVGGVEEFMAGVVFDEEGGGVVARGGEGDVVVVIEEAAGGGAVGVGGDGFALAVLPLEGARAGGDAEAELLAGVGGGGERDELRGDAEGAGVFEDGDFFFDEFDPGGEVFAGADVGEGDFIAGFLGADEGGELGGVDEELVVEFFEDIVLEETGLIGGGAFST